MPSPPRFPGRISDWILYKDKQLLVFNKPAGLSVAPDRTPGPNLLGLGAAYARHDLYLIHRLDRPVSGAIVYGKKPSAQTALTEQFKAGTVEKTYLAVVATRPEAGSGTLTHYLSDGKGNKTTVSETPAEGTREARLDYTYLASSDRYHLLEIKLHTGRKHQIRAQLAAIGSPIRGDEKYGFKRANEDGTVDLHARSIAFNHPTSDKRQEHLAPLPETPIWQAFRAHL